MSHSEIIKLMGKEPINPIGQCFDSTAKEAIFNPELPNNIVICHGIGIATMPGQKGNTIAHSWIEAGDKAYDTTWGVIVKAKRYRKQLKINYVICYSFRKFVQLSLANNNSGPWDEKIQAVINDKVAKTSEIKEDAAQS